MLFNSYSFLLFLLSVVVVSRRLENWTSRKAFLLFCSYAFYAAWNPPFVFLLWISTIADWVFAKKIDLSSSSTKRRIYLAASLFVNLGLLAFFKYGSFILNNFTAALMMAGIRWSPPESSIILPVGISFYTFQTLSYTLDVYRRRMKPAKNFLDYALYVTFFPQLVAGPIVRATDFLPQCVQPRKASASQLGWGLSLLVVGLFNKVVIADAMMAPYVELIYDNATAFSFVDAWAATFAFAVQIFCDFAGYSTCAIGVALCLGFDLPDNFRFPYAAAGFSDFWGRWHISLSSWLRDYLYISLGGNRKGSGRTYINLLLTMLIGGLWHGASWMFVVWGGLHGFYLVAEKVLNKYIGRMAVWATLFGQIILVGLTFLLTCVAWVFFRAKSMGAAKEIFSAMFCLSSADRTLGRALLLIWSVTLTMLILQWFMRDKTLETLFSKLPWCMRSLVLAIMALAVLMCMNGDDSAFIYFQF